MTSAQLFDLKGNVALVTGALGLLGREHAHALASHGADLALLDLDAAELEVFASTLTKQHNVRAIGLRCDLTERSTLEAAAAAIERRLGSPSVLVNNAAINDKFEGHEERAALTRFEAYPLERWRKAFEVNVTGTFLACQVFGTPMAERGRGSIINIASTYGVVAPDQSLYLKPDGSRSFYKSPEYPATKGAVLSFTRYLAAYWGPRQVRVNALSPGGVLNGQDEYFVENYARRTPLHRMAAPGDYRGAIVFLASDASSYMTGANLVVDGGFTIW